VCIRGRLTVNTINAKTKGYAFTALQLLVRAACLSSAGCVALLQVDDGRSRRGNYECEDSEDVLGEHLESVLDC
jgi:hypothetical protein